MNTLAHHMKINRKANRIEKLKRSFAKRYTQVHNVFSKNKLHTDIATFDYFSVWDNILSKDFNENVYAGAFIDWDNTPRRQKDGSVCLNSSPENFQYYFSALYKKAKQQNCPYIFINAWNEWAEGTYLEPDIKNEYKYLEIIKDTVDNL